MAVVLAVAAEQHVVSVDAPTPAVQTLTPAASVSVSLPQPQAAMPIAVQGCPQVDNSLVVENVMHSP